MSEQGFSLIEIICVILVFGLVLATLSHIAVHGLRYDRAGVGRAAMERAAVFAFEELVHGVHGENGLTAAVQVHDLGSSGLKYIMPDSTEVTYYLSGNKLMRSEPTGTTTVIENVTRFEVDKMSNDYVRVDLEVELDTPFGDAVPYELTTAIRLRNYH